jgi:uncharacterized OB-fold protein
MTSSDELQTRLESFVGIEGEPVTARDPVNPPMIRHWCDAVDDRNPVYTQPAFAEESVHGSIVAPPTMLMAWTMPGLRPPEEEGPATGPLREAMELLDAAGFTSVVATNCRQEYRRYLVPGDLLCVTSAIESISPEKQTALGVGHFVSQESIYRDERGVEVARMKFRILKFRPREIASPPSGDSAAGKPLARGRLRPRPARSRDNAFFWEGVQQGRLLFQRCTGCGRLQHPPGPMCPACHGLEWDLVESSGRGQVYSFVVAHHPPIPPFEYPNAVVLVELEEGTRLVSNLLGVDPAKIEIGMPVEVEFTEVDPDLVLPLFRPVG